MASRDCVYLILSKYNSSVNCPFLYAAFVITHLNKNLAFSSTFLRNSTILIYLFSHKEMPIYEMIKCKNESKFIELHFFT